eukprot:8155099-Alexandrium_andersonii.AAC.1
MSSKIHTFDPACPELASLRLALSGAAGPRLASSQSAAAFSAASARASCRAPAAPQAARPSCRDP